MRETWAWWHSTWASVTWTERSPAADPIRSRRGPPVTASNSAPRARETAGPIAAERCELDPLFSPGAFHTSIIPCVWPDPTSVIDKFALRRQRLRNDRLSDKQASRKEGRHKKALKLDLYTSKCILRACSCALTGDEAIRKNCSASQHEVISYSTAYCHAGQIMDAGK